MLDAPGEPRGLNGKNLFAVPGSVRFIGEEGAGGVQDSLQDVGNGRAAETYAARAVTGAGRAGRQAGRRVPQRPLTRARARVYI